MKKITLLACIGFMIIAPSVVVAEQMSSKDISWLENKPEIKAMGCSSYEGDPSGGRSGVKITESSFSTDRLFSDGSLTCYLSMNIDDLDMPKLSIIEKTKLNGVDVSVFHSDGSGTIGKGYSDKQAWQSACKKDAMTDEVTCQIHQGNLFLFKDKSGYSVGVGGELYPKTNAFIRLGKDKPLQAKYESIFSAEQTDQIISGLTAGDKVLTRYTKWPNKTDIDESIDAKYFLSAKKVLDLIYEKHN